MQQTIVAVCSILQRLCQEVIAFMQSFTRLNATIKAALREQAGMKATLRDLRDDLDDAEYSGAPPRMQRSDYIDFRNQLHEMRKQSLRMNGLAALYADIIADVINPGFSRVVESAFSTDGDQEGVFLTNKYKYGSGAAEFED